MAKNSKNANRVDSFIWHLRVSSAGGGLKNLEGAIQYIRSFEGCLASDATQNLKGGGANGPLTPPPVPSALEKKTECKA